MKILEVRDGFIKLEAQEKVSLSSFLEVNGREKNYIAQVVQVKVFEEKTIVIAKILFVYDGTLSKYDGSTPDKDSEIKEFTFDILSKTLEYEIPIVAGKFINGSVDIPIDKRCFDKKMLISVDSPKVSNKIISNLTKQFAYLGKVVVVDMLGAVDSQKYTAGVDFKLPLNTESLDFMYEDCLNDATSDSKSLIKEIFDDLAEYSKSVPFLPFDALKNIVDDMVDKSHVFKLLVLKNKLAKFAQQGYFAATSIEAQNLEKILAEKFVIIDLSKLDSIFQNRYLETIYSILEKQNSVTQVFIEASNSLNKKNIKRILENDSVASVFVTHSKFKYINEIKAMFDNFIIEPTFANKEIFKIYSAYLNFMPKETYLLVGEGTNYIPLISSLEAVINIPQMLEKEVVVEEEPDNEEVPEAIIEEPLETETQEKSGEIDAEAIIEQKADELINKITEETQTVEISEDSNIFDEEIVEKEEFVEDSEPVEEPSVESVELEISDLEENDFAQDFVEEESAETLESESVEADVELEEISALSEPEEEIIEVEEGIAEEGIAEEGIAEGIVSEFSDEFHTDVDAIQTIEIPEDISELADDIELEVEEKQEDNEFEESDSAEVSISDAANELEQRLDFDADSVGFKEYSEADAPPEEVETVEQDVISLSKDDGFEAIVELGEDELDGEDAILVELDEDEELDEESLDREIVEDVDKVFTTIKEDTISDSDLDFIDELNNEDEQEILEEVSESSFEELSADFNEEDSEEGFLEPIEEQEELSLDNNDEILETRNTKTPIVPVYDADIPAEDMVMSDAIEQGDSVVHVKFGNGVVEKMIKYGTKTLYSINFDNVGRRLLDPTLTEIKKA